MARAPFIGQEPPAVADRPRCPSCDTPLQPQVWSKEERIEDGEGFRYRTVAR